MRQIHKDTGKEKDGPMAFCTGAEYGVVCTDEWLDVTCAACHEQRHPQAPLSLDERVSEKRATGAGTSRALTTEEIAYDREHRDIQWGRR